MSTLRRDFLKKIALGTAVAMGGVAASSNPAAPEPPPVPPIYSIRRRNFGISTHRRISSPACIRQWKPSSPSSARPF